MNDETKQLIKWAAIAAAGYFVYEYLQSSGLWAQWFGGALPATGVSNSFSSSAALLTYCQANPTGTAIYVDPTTGVSSTASCAQWIGSNSSSPIPAAPASPATGLATGYQQAIAAMKTAAGNDSQTIDQWGYYWQNTPTFSGAPMGFGVSGSISAEQSQLIQGFNGNNPNAPISAEQFVAWMQQTPPIFTSNDPAAAPTYGGPTTGMQGYDFGDWIN